VTIPNYLATFRRAVRDLAVPEKGAIRETSSAVISLNSLISHPTTSEVVRGVRRLPAPEAWARGGAWLDRRGIIWIAHAAGEAASELQPIVPL
jgi:hypothetical protein